MKAFSRRLSPLLILVILALNSGCSTLSKNDDPNLHVSADPLEGFNRSMYAFNDKADKIVLRPVAKAYDAVLPDPAQRGVTRFFSNLGEPFNAVNNLLQGKFEDALSSTYRFVVNSTVGLLGFLDVAKSYEVEEQPEDLGQTLAAWGVKPGPYLVIPLLGPSNLRDGVGNVVGNFGYYPINEITDDSGGRIALTVLNLVDTRANLLGTDEVLDKQLDPYLFLKTAYEANRINAIYDGDPPEQGDDDLEF